MRCITDFNDNNIKHAAPLFRDGMFCVLEN
jgi:hypothetical protein